MSTVMPMHANRDMILRVENLEVIYQRAITAVQGISIDVAERSITALVGTNGAGKSTTLAAIAGFMRADDVQMPQGQITFRGRRIERMANHRISALGIALIPERDKTFTTMTVEENLIACRPRFSNPRVMRLDTVYELFPRLAQRRHGVAGYLSGGERQMLAISMALVAGPELLLIDEMSLGLAPVIVAQLQQVVRQLRDEHGLSVCVVEQSATTAIDIADYIYVMENGRVVFDGTPDKLKGHADFQEFYLGMGNEGERSYRDVKQYRRKRRWFG